MADRDSYVGKRACLGISGDCAEGDAMQAGWAMVDRLKVFALGSAVVIQKGMKCSQGRHW